MTRSSWHLRANLPVLGWILVVAVLSVVHRWVPHSLWMMLHATVLGAATSAILVWSAHFSDALLKTRLSRRSLAIRLVVVNVGAVLVLAGRPLDRWEVLAAGAVLVAGGVLAHAVALGRRLTRSLPSRFGATVRFYVLAAVLLVLAVTFGALLATDPTDAMRARLLIAHLGTAVLGWIGLTVLGTVLTLLPTVLRTRLQPGTDERIGAGPWAVAGASAVIAAGALAGLRPVVAVGIAAYLVATIWLLAPPVAAVRSRPPTSYAAWSMILSLGWLVVSLVALLAMALTSRSFVVLADRSTWLIGPLAAGFVAQVLLGALSYLLPVVLRGGPAVTKRMNATLDAGLGWRLVLINGGLALFAVPAPSLVKVVASTVALFGLLAFVPLALRAVRHSRRRTAPAALPASSTSGRSGAVGSAVVGAAVLLLGITTAVAVDPAATGVGGASAAGDVATTGNTTEVQVSAKDMAFTPSSITVPAGDRLVITVVNDDPSQVHDLTLDTGQTTGRLAPGETGTVDVGVVGRSVEAWCSVVGHRQMGMTLDIVVTGGAVAAGESEPADSTPPADHGQHSADTDSPVPTHTTYDAALTPAPGTTTHKVTLTVQELVAEVAPGMTQQIWTFNGRMPGPTLRGKVGDVFEITLVNDGSMGHSVDFHAGDIAPDVPMRTIQPGESLVYTFTAKRSGIWLYHCATMPMSAHIASGMFGAVIIDPPDLAPVDREYLLIQSELYLGQKGELLDTDKLNRDEPDLWVFNGYANQYDKAPLTAVVGERVRIWVLAAGPNRGIAYHVIGGQFDTVFKEGAFLLQPGGTGGSQVLDLSVAQGGFVELTFVEPGSYPMVNHSMVAAEHGAHGMIKVS